MSSQTEKTEVWAIVDLMGHVKLAGRLSEVEQFGGKLGRVDIPYILPDCTSCKGTGRVGNPDEWCRFCNGFVTRLFGAASVYSIAYVSEAVARDVARRNRNEPVAAWDYPKALPAREPVLFGQETMPPRPPGYLANEQDAERFGGGVEDEGREDDDGF